MSFFLFVFLFIPILEHFFLTSHQTNQPLYEKYL